MRVSCAFGLKIFLNMLKIFLEARRVSGVLYMYVSNTFHARYRRVKYALNAFGVRFRHASVRYMRVPILRNIAEVTCPKRV